MSCVIPAQGVKVFGKAIHALARIGDDLYLEPLSTGLVFRTVNSSRSAYVCFTFQPPFFSQYVDNSSSKCKVLLKSCLVAFRSLATLEKTVDKCLVDLLNMEDYLLLQFNCKHDMTKIYHLPFIENETVHANIEDRGYKCKLTASSRLLQDGIQNFSNSVEEVTLMIYTSKVMLKNYVDDEPDPNKVVHTEITLESDEFEDYVVEEETIVTFCLKELKAILIFSEGCGASITINCQAAGKPIIFSINGLQDVQGEFVLATLAEKDNTQSTARSARLEPIVSNFRTRKEHTLQNKRNPKNTHGTPIATPSERAPANVIRDPPLGGPSLQLLDDADDSSFEIPEEDIDFEAVDMVPTTPPRKKFRSSFLGLSQATYTSMAPDPDEVLVENSDEDELL